MPKNQETSESNTRYSALDVLRGIAVLMVLIVHAPLPIAFIQKSETDPIFSLLKNLISLGSYGVDLFFVLSGFLISGLLFSEIKKKGKIDLLKFWIRRGFKIYPSYYIAYGIMLLIQIYFDLRANQTITPRLVGAIPNIFFVQNYIYPEMRWMASWSLAIEEHFYFFLPVFFTILI